VIDDVLQLLLSLLKISLENAKTKGVMFHEKETATTFIVMAASGMRNGIFVAHE
jgi:hypothetical protein